MKPYYYAFVVFSLLACQSSSRPTTHSGNALPTDKPSAITQAVQATGSASQSAISSQSWLPTMSCEQPLFIEQIKQWQEKRINGGGMDAIRQAIEVAPKNQPVKLILAAGTYQGQCLYIENHHRSAQAPLWIKGEGPVQIDCTDGNGQAIALENSSWIAIDNLIVGPDQGYYGDSAVHIAGHPLEIENPAKYGQYQISHHIIVRNLRARNLNRGPDGDSNPEAFESGCCDGIKVNQAEHVWLLDNLISRTARHGIDMVGVHHAAVCRNQLYHMVGAGQGMEAKGGSEDILFEANTVFGARHRALLLGGEGTADVYMYPVGAKYEGTRQLARNNILINASEGGLGFYGCQDCAAIANTIWQTPGFKSETRDLIRMYPSILEAADEWGGARRVGEVIPSQNNQVFNNVLGAAEPGITCALEAGENAVAGLRMHHNLWWNGGQELPECGEGAYSIRHYPDSHSFFADKDPLFSQIGSTTLLPQLVPQTTSPLLKAGIAHPLNSKWDAKGKMRQSPPTLGALETNS